MFIANMTGNTVLLGVAIARGSGSDALRAVSALAGFCIGVSAGTILIGRDEGEFPYFARRALIFETASLVALLVWWAASGAAAARYELVAIAGLAMGVQSAAVLAAHTGGVATTYVTGTLTSAIARVTKRLRGSAGSGAGPGLPGEVWATYAVGAIAGGATEKWWGAGAVVIPLAVVSAVTAVAILGRSKSSR